jgi:hypothetical protein
MVSINFRQIVDFSSGSVVPDAMPSAIHSGNAGDILYALPTIRALGVRHLYLNVFESPTDPVRKLTEETALALAPLLLAQSYIDRVTVVEAGVSLEQVLPESINVDVVLDRFRLIPSADLHLIAAHARACGARVSANEPFLTVPPAPSEEPYVVLALTPRYRSLTDEFVRQAMLCFRRVLLVGLPGEWRTVSGIGGEVWQAPDFLALAQRIEAAALFIGNPNLPNAIAEGLKCPRVVDLPADIRNAFPIGPRGYVIPSRRADFLELLAVLCSESPVLASCCRTEMLPPLGEIAQAAKTANPEISLFEEAAAGRCTARLAAPDLYRFAENGILLHPPTPGLPPSQLTFPSLKLRGPYRFSASASVEHPESAPVLMSIEFRTANDAQPLRWSSEVIPGATERIELDLPSSDAAWSCVLTTAIQDPARSPNYAWSWLRSPRLTPA